MSTATTWATPAPWGYRPASEDGYAFEIIGSDRDVDAVLALTVDRGLPATDEDNARLVAAAPRLLAALRDIVACIDKGGCPVNGSVMHEAGRAAIEAAEAR